MPSSPGHSNKNQASYPEVERPSFHIWQPLEAESIQWEGQVLIVGGSADMPALLAVTSQRLALIANGQIMLDFPRQWLRPAPKLAAENGVRIFINPDGGNGEANPVLLRAREGRGAAMELVAVLTGRPLTATKTAGGVLIPNWKDTVGAARAVALPQLSEEPEAAPRPRTQSFWPPQETSGVSATPKPAAAATTTRKPSANRPMQQLADQHRTMAEPRPVPASVSRAARKQGTREDGVTVRDDNGWQDEHFQANTARRRGPGAWLLSAAIALMLIGGIGFVVQDKYDLTLDDLRERIPANVQESLGIGPADDQDVALNTAPDPVDVPQERESDGTDGSGRGTTGSAQQPESTDAAVVAPTEESTGEEAAVEDELPSSDVDDEPLDPTTGLGGPTTALPETEPVTDEQEQQDPTAPVETVAPTNEPVVEPTVEIVEPTEEIVPTAEPTEEPIVEPTVEPTAEPTQEPAPTAEPTVAVQPTEEIVEPTEEPVVEPTAEPTEEATVEPTAEPTEEASETPTVESQEPSVLPETTPEQAVVSDGFRYTIEGASVGATVPELPEINSVAGYGQWVVLNVYAQNMSGDVQVFDMSNFVLYADGQEVELDSGNAWVNGLVGNTPAYGPTDAIQWASGESHAVALTFLAPADATSLVLQAGDQTIDISPAIENPAPILSEGPRIESDLIQGTVVEVVDGETIVVDIDGVQQTVRYLGLDVPTGDACYAAEAADANRSLVEGQTVVIERQSTDKDARGNWVRDIWVMDDAGLPVLVSQQLIAQGAAEAHISEPNTRFAGWLQQTQSAAQQDGTGLWGACGE